MRGLFLRSCAIAFVAFATLFGVEFFAEWAGHGYPGLHQMSWAGVNNAKLVDVLSPMARAYNNILAMLIATIGVALPLTANMNTPKLIEMFLKDTINRWVLSFMMLGAGNVLFVDYIVGPEFAPMWAVRTSVFFALVGWALLIPYFFYVVRFVDPSRLLVRLREDANRIVARTAERRTDPQRAQAELGTRVGQIGTVMLKSLERSDRDVAAEGAWALKTLLDRYGQFKARMPGEWFVVDRGDFLGLSDDALEMLSENKTWYEMKCLQQIEFGFLRALAGTVDNLSTFSDALRVIGERSHARRDEQTTRLCIRYFNNFLRESIKEKNLRAIYDVFHQYRKLARALVSHDALIREIGGHFVYYAEMAREYELVFAPQLAVFDLGFVTRRAYEHASPAAAELLRECLALPHRTGTDLHTMAVKAKLILGSFFVARKREPEAELVRKNLADVDPVHVEAAEADLLAADRSFFEVTDRQLNLEYIPPDRRDALHAFVESLTASTTAPG